ncbi:TPA: hypothetical protein HA242_05770 [Candidatus Woesearchaeota archaeon]|nr:hypothetical protein [Candidatus Woesearchaeota archaeon]
MREYSLSADFVKRFRAYLSSELYEKVSPYSKSEYWEYHADVINISISGNKITMSGESGFYIPSIKNIRKLGRTHLIALIKEPSKLIPFIKRKIGIQESEIKLLSYFNAFNKVMNHDSITDPILSRYRINCRKLKEKPGAIVSIDDMRQKFFAKSKYNLSPHIVMSYYFYNILNGFIDLYKVKTVLEIGGGVEIWHQCFIVL